MIPGHLNVLCLIICILPMITELCNCIVYEHLLHVCVVKCDFQKQKSVLPKASESFACWS